MSRTMDVIRNKNKVEKELRKRRQEEIVQMRKNTSFRASAMEIFKKIDILLEDDEIESISIRISDEDLTDFGSMMLGRELANYEIRQLEPNKFQVKKKYINL